MRTPLNKVRGLGSAKEGAEHFWRQRLTALANIPLILFLVVTLAALAGADHGAVTRYLASPFAAIPMLLLIVSATVHMRLGMQTIIEDYVQAEGPKVVCLMLNTFFAFGVGLACAYAILKLGFGS